MTPPSVEDFQNFFMRDFPYGTTLDKVLDEDVQKAICEASVIINPGLFTSDEKYRIAYLYLSAHLMVMNLRASSQGISGNFAWLEASKAVGSVSQGFSIPQYILDHPILSMLSKTTYGAKYLGLILPSLVGQVFSIHGRTHS